MHNINLVFHETGHVVFRLFGWFMPILGASSRCHWPSRSRLSSRAVIISGRRSVCGGGDRVSWMLRPTSMTPWIISWCCRAPAPAPTCPEPRLEQYTRRPQSPEKVLRLRHGRRYGRDNAGDHRLTLGRINPVPAIPYAACGLIPEANDVPVLPGFILFQSQ